MVAVQASSAVDGFMIGGGSVRAILVVRLTLEKIEEQTICG